MLVVIHICEQDVTPENWLRHRPYDKVTSFTNIVYSESMDACYRGFRNSEAAENIKTFIK